MLTTLLDYFFPHYCLVCSADTFGPKAGFICPECRAKMQRPANTACRFCSAPITQTKNRSGKTATAPACRTCKKRKTYLQLCLSPCLYTRQAKQVIGHCKFFGKTGLVPEMAEIMADYAAKRLITPPDVVTAVPRHPLKSVFAPRPHTNLLAQNIARIMGIEFVPGMLKKTRLHTSQKKLSYKKRLENVKNSFACQKPRQSNGANILLIDDVIATGSTVNECANVLVQSGAQSVSALAFAVTLPPAGS